MNDDLVGYLMGALDPHEVEQIENAIRENPALQIDLDRIRASLAPLDQIAIQGEEIPSGLLTRTLQRLDQPVEPDTTNAGVGVDDALRSAKSVMSPPNVNARLARGHSPANFFVALVSAAILLAFAFPAINRWRESSRRIICVDQLRQLGTQLTQYVTRDAEGRLPAIEPEGAEAFAGIYAVRLHDAGLMPDPNVRWCPTEDTIRNANARFIDVGQLASASTIRSADVNSLRELQRWSGGDYAFNLGVRDGAIYTPPKFESRTSFAVLSDAPTIRGDDRHGSFTGPHIDGINVLYEDGSVSFVSINEVASLPDHPLLNHDGRPEAGVTIDDASLAPSWRAPFTNVRQR